MAARLAISIDPKAEQSPSEQLVAQLCFAVAAQRILEGERLPSVRALAVEAAVNPNTIGKSWRDLERLGLLDSRPGDGVFVALGACAKARELRDQLLGKLLTRWIDEAQSSGLSRQDLERSFALALAQRRTWNSMEASA